MRYATYAQNGYADGIAISLLALASVVIFGLLLRTLLGIVRGELRTLTAISLRIDSELRTLLAMPARDAQIWKIEYNVKMLEPGQLGSTCGSYTS
jgi:hypothetical protein